MLLASIHLHNLYKLIKPYILAAMKDKFCEFVRILIKLENFIVRNPCASCFYFLVLLFIHLNFSVTH